jgi:hypothetical protein
MARPWPHKSAQHGRAVFAPEACDKLAKRGRYLRRVCDHAPGINWRRLMVHCLARTVILPDGGVFATMRPAGSLTAQKGGLEETGRQAQKGALLPVGDSITMILCMR